MADDLDILAELQDELFWKDSGWIKTPPNEKGEFAIYPKTVKDEAAWERSALEMHRLQASVVMPPEQPKENMMLRKRRELSRGN